MRGQGTAHAPVDVKDGNSEVLDGILKVIRFSLSAVDYMSNTQLAEQELFVCCIIDAADVYA
jgi:hypothetical protein